MSSRTAMAHIGALVRAKRREEDLGLRAASDRSGVSASTLSRLERGAATAFPDAETLSKLSVWLQLPVGSLIAEAPPLNPEAPPDLSTPEAVHVHLRADKTLSPQTADALAKMFKMLYEQFTQIEQRSSSDAEVGEPGRDQQALHRVG